MKNALITGITGQDGSFMAEFLLKMGYRVFGTVRRLSTPNLENIKDIKDDITLISADLMDQTSLDNAVRVSKPDEVYNFAAQSFVSASVDQPILTGEVTGLGVTRMLEAVRNNKPDARFYQASSSEMFGNAITSPQNEQTPFHPRSPYGSAKVYGHYMVQNYRESYGMFACSGIAFNHESERRGLEFVTRKISNAVARIYYGKQDHLDLGNIDTKRDWGYAPEYVEGMWRMLQNDNPVDYVLSTGQQHSIRDFLGEAFGIVGLDWKKYTRYNTDQNLRPAEVFSLVGDSSKAKWELGWNPTCSFRDLVRKMVGEDLVRERISSKS